MKPLHAAVFATLMTSTLALGAIAPATAQDAPPPARETSAPAPAQAFPHPHRHVGSGAGDLLRFNRGAEAIEVSLVRLSHRLDLTDEQKTLLEDLKTASLSAAGEFETATKDLRPTPPAPGAVADAAKAPPAPDFSKNLDARIALGKANVAALETIKPSYDAFFSSLSDEQKAQLTPAPRDRDGRPGQRGRDGKRGPHGDHRPNGPAHR
jgi:hypothetical protein